MEGATSGGASVGEEGRRHGIHGDGSGNDGNLGDLISFDINGGDVLHESDLQCLLECKYGRWNGS